MAVAAETLLLFVLAVAAVFLTVSRGPSECARQVLAAYLAGQGAVGSFIAEHLDRGRGETEAFPEKNEAPEEDAIVTISGDEDSTDDWGLNDDDGDGIIICPVYGHGFSGTMMVVLDPTRVAVGFFPQKLGSRGYTVGEMAESFGAVAAINAGGFLDEGGTGSGALPDSVVVYEGELYCATRGVRQGFVGLDEYGKLYVGLRNVKEIQEANIQYGVSFGPVLIKDGVPSDEETLRSDLNPRSAIGQRADGAILLLVVDGRQVVSMGANMSDMVTVMQQFGAVNACNLDGGTSSLLWYNGEYLNDRAELFQPRPVPDTFLVMEKGAEP